MQEQRNSNSGFQNRESFYERLNSNVSIDRFAIRSNSPVLDHKISLIDAMEIEMPDRKSDLYQNILGDPRTSNYKRGSNISRGERGSKHSRQSGNQNEIMQEEQNLRVLSHKYIHQCNCDKQCIQDYCSCFLYPNQLCVIGLCCQNCIKRKNQFLSQQSNHVPTSGCFCKNIKCLKMYCSCYREGRKCNPNVCKCQGCQNDTNGLLQKKKKKIESQFKREGHHFSRQNYHLAGKQGKNKNAFNNVGYSFINCSCKKSHCLKKYCSCYLNNKCCNETCACQDCYNTVEHEDEDDMSRRARYARHDIQNEFQDMHNNMNEIDQFLETQDNFQKQQFHENMEFQPVNFQNIGK